MKLPAIKVKSMQGSEQFRLEVDALDLQLRDYWSWAYSDLISNTARGVFAEFLVASALGVTGSVRREWDAVDLISPAGTRIEVKSAAYIQSWHQDDYSRINFRIAPTRAWDEISNEYAAEPRRNSDVYVFCLLAEKDPQMIDPLNLDQWRFFVLNTNILDQQLGAQETLALSRLLQLQPLEVPYTQLAEAIKKLALNHKTA